jgi:hypothetical protein
MYMSLFGTFLMICRCGPMLNIKAPFFLSFLLANGGGKVNPKKETKAE